MKMEEGDTLRDTGGHYKLERARKGKGAILP